jgi:hypothetical protein
MIKWNNVCLPKEFGGEGVINTKLLNEALIWKWVWRLLNCEEEDVCCQLLRAKYFPNEAFRHIWGSQFWMRVQNMKDKIKWGVTCTVNCEKQTHFWEDVWI